MSAASKENVQLLRAVVKHSTLYDRGDENYRKRLATDNSWDLVASEVGESVEKCKRRWRQLRNDYTRWCNSDANRRRQGQRRFPYPLAEELRFLDRHLNLADANPEAESRSGSERDRDSNRDSESRDNYPPSVKGDATLDDKPVIVESSVAQLLREENSSSKQVEKDKTKEKPKQKKAAQEKSVEKELEELEEPYQDSYLQSDQEGEDPIEEEHLEQLEDFDFEDEESLQEVKEKESKEKEKEKEKSADSPASQSEFFIKQNKEPHLLIIGKKNSAFSRGEQPEADDSSLGDPLEESTMEENTDETAAKNLRRRDSTQSPSRRLRRLKEAPIKKPTQAQRLTRFQRTKSISMAVGQSMRSSTSPVKMTPVPRTVMATKSVQVKKVSALQDDIFPRPAVPPAEGRQNLRQTMSQSQPLRQPVVYPRRGTAAGGNSQETPTAPPRRGVGRPPKKLELPQRLTGPQVRQQSPSAPNVLTISKPSPAGNTGPGLPVANKGTNPTNNPTGKMTTQQLKSSENKGLMNYSPSSSSSATASTTTPSRNSSPSRTMITGVASSSATVSSISVSQHLALVKRSDRTTQTECQDVFSDDHFLEMIKPQLKEMNARQKMHFKKKVFQALMETFDDATDFPEAGELQHFNINTPSGFEHVTDPELRLIRELVSMVSAAKVSPRGQPQAQSQSQPPAQLQAKEGVCFTGVPGSDVLRGTRSVNIPRHLIQRVYKQGHGGEIVANSTGSQGGEKKLYRFLQTSNGKPNGGNISASLEDLRKDSVDSEHSVVRSAHIPPASPKGATIVAAVRPQGSSINTFFGHPNSVSAVKSGPSLKARALARRYSICSNGNQGPNGLPLNQAPANASSLNVNLNPMEAAALKRRMMGAGQSMVPPTQRPRYSAGPGVQHIVTPQGNSLLVRKSIGNPPGLQKQPSPTTPQKTPQITNVQGGAFKDFAQPKPAAAAAATSPGSTASSGSGEGSTSQSTALKRSLVVANAKGSSSLLVEKPANKPQQSQAQKPRYSSMTAATIAADDFSMASLKHEPMDHVGDPDDILGM